MMFRISTPVRFAHIDAAGIVFYPRYFEMLNAALEDFFAHAVGVDFNTLHLQRKIGVPTVNLESEFFAPSFLGDQLDIDVSVERLGSSSLGLAFDFTCGGERRLVARNVLVCMDLATKTSKPWPDDMRRGLSAAKADRA